MNFAKLASHLTRATLVALCFTAFACGGTENEESENAALINNGGGLNETGGGCTVNEGPHAGMKGTYDADGWCCAELTCVECTTPTGGSRCTSNAQVVIGRPVVSSVGTVLAH
jgi:hypothetical protein